MYHPVLKHYSVDWLAAFLLVGFFFLVAEKAQPFFREFYLGDLSLSHPFTAHEKVTGHECMAISFFVPVLTIVAVLLARARGFNQRCMAQALVAILAVLLALALDGITTDYLKNWIARPRPDFLERCGAKPGTPKNVLVTIDVCTAPLGHRALVDGMRLTPSGHSLISFCGLGFLTLWLLGQFKLMQSNSREPIYKYLIVFLPVLGLTYIALSRTQDYRHHFGDVISGSILGLVFAWVFYHRYFPKFTDEDCDEPKKTEDIRPILPQ